MKYKLTLFVFVFAIIGCESESDSKLRTLENPAFQIEQTLSAEVIEISEDLFAVSSVNVSGNKLIISDDGTDSVFKIFELPTLEFLYKDGVVGNGPGELQSPFSESTFVSGDLLEVQDNNKIKRFRIGKNNFEYLGAELLPLIGNPINGLKKVNDSIYIALNAMEDASSEFISINLEKSEVSFKFSPYNDDGFSFPNSMARYQIYLKSSTVNSDVGRLASFYYFFNKFKIHNLKGELLHEIDIVNDRYTNTEIILDQAVKNVMYHVKPYSNSDFIFTMELGETKDEVLETQDTFKPLINVWDWEGNPIARFQIDRLLSNFTVVGNKLYGTPISALRELYIYELPELPKQTKLAKRNLKKSKSEYYETFIPTEWSEHNKVESFKELGLDCLQQYFFDFSDESTCPSAGSGLIRAYSSDLEPFTLDKYVNIYGKGQNAIVETNKIATETFGIKEVVSHKITLVDKTSKGAPDLHSKTWAWSEGDYIVSFSYSTCSNPDNFDQYIPEIISNTKIY